jgi:predicted nuclease of predicted toxin-antitoxin system
MSRPRYLADDDLNDAIVVGLGRREPAAAFARLRDLGLATWTDPDVLGFAAAENGIVVSHDVNTMREAANTRLTAGLPMSGLLLASQRTAVSAIIESLLLIWAASEAEEWPARSGSCRSETVERSAGRINDGHSLTLAIPAMIDSRRNCHECHRRDNRRDS